jgi:hypothetical protein
LAAPLQVLLALGATRVLVEDNLLNVLIGWCFRAHNCKHGAHFNEIAEVRVFIAFFTNKATIIALRKHLRLKTLKISLFDWNCGKKMKK